ncbi:MAG: SET domain-containing protein-lysine N-methyltransferase [Nitrososphaerota archaeon]|nr:SET domain-containing protein-lysine N-methyltransferase [Nitrososphaerota archaeon]MDG6923464.1 SET domain-containing protein-lysine N-methyltransferase [Nitrososphaerota archaeon]
MLWLLCQDWRKVAFPTERPEIYINHSCDPNTTARKLIDGLEFTAVRDIMEGEELSFDYGTVITKGDNFSFKCNCGNKNYRKIIRAL